ncbi:MAG TPA: hypothetical protein VLS51_08540 [Propionibacteriaceae bacterium]|nr:hypothetical protein [Propionibacteriaceae bacterium]
MSWQPAPPIILSTRVSATPLLGLAGGVGTIKYQASLDTRLTQISIAADSGQQGVATLYIGEVFVMLSANAWGDVADGDPPLILSTGETLKIDLTGFYAGSAGVGGSDPAALVVVRIENEQDVTA